MYSRIVSVDKSNPNGIATKWKTDTYPKITIFKFDIYWLWRRRRYWMKKKLTNKQVPHSRCVAWCRLRARGGNSDEIYERWTTNKGPSVWLYPYRSINLFAANGSWFGRVSLFNLSFHFSWFQTKFPPIQRIHIDFKKTSFKSLNYTWTAYWAVNIYAPNLMSLTMPILFE